MNEITWRLSWIVWGMCWRPTRLRRHAIEDLGMIAVVALIHPDNEASAPVAARIGLAPAGEMFAHGKQQRVFSTRGAPAP
ncbi:MAG: hypothetical protein AB7P02_23595 [Alphaproteobacteria bacterium]